MIVRPLNALHGVVQVPGDKSITHRAIMLNAAAEGSATVTGALLGADCLATIDCMRRLGAEIEIDGTTVRIRGAKKFKNRQTLYVGNSGTTMRLLTGLLAGRGVSATLDGDASIRRRPMARVTEPLETMGARVETTEGRAPLRVRPAELHGIRYEMPVASAQVKSALLLAGLGAAGTTTVVEPLPTRDHTEILLEAMSADVRVDGPAVSVRASALKSVDVSVPADLSSAAYPIVLATALPDASIVIRGVGVNPTRRALIDLINAHGGKITLLNRRVCCGEKVADLMVQSAAVRPFAAGGALIPNLIDEIPVLAVLAAAIEGDSRFYDAQELRVKESDRIAATVDALGALGVRAEATADGLIVHGTGVIMGGGKIDPRGDHRMAMSMAVAAALSADGAEIADDGVTDVSYPGFYALFSHLAQGEEK